MNDPENFEKLVLQALARNDWSEILVLSKKKVFRRKLQIVDAFIKRVEVQGLLDISHSSLAKDCRVTRQLVDHHFPTRNSLILLAYRFVYARLQKQVSDSVVARSGFANQFRAYILGCASWVARNRADARFLIQFYALAPTDPELSEMHRRNTAIGVERITAMFSQGQKSSAFFKKKTPDELSRLASSIQQLLIGYNVLFSTARDSSLSVKRAEDELWRASLAIIHS